MSIEELVAATVARVVREEFRGVLREALSEFKPKASGDYLTPDEAARIAGVHVDTIRLWMKMGKLPSHRVGSRLRVLREDLDRFLTSGGPDDGGPSAGAIAAAARARRKGG